jgi:hypothetical protein
MYLFITLIHTMEQENIMNRKKEKYKSILTDSLQQEKLYRVEKIKQEIDRENQRLLKTLFGDNIPKSYKGLN